MLDEGQRREALGVALIMLGLLAGLALISPEATDGRNWIGPAGAFLNRGLRFAFGPLSPMLAISAFVWGAHFLGWGDPGRAIRASLLPAGLVLVLPTLFWIILSRDGATAAEVGWLGRAVGSALSSAFGWIGALLILASLLVVTLVLTLGWSLTRTVAQGGRAAVRGWSAGTVGARSLAGAVAELYRAEPETAGATPWETGGPRLVPDSPADEASAPSTPKKPSAKKRSARKSAAGKKPSQNGAPVEAAPEEVSDIPALADPGDLDQDALPPIELLEAPLARGSGLAAGDLDRLGNVLIEKLATFRIAGEIGGWTTGPVVTQFEVVPAPGVKVGQISARADDLALALKAPSVRIVAPIPGKGAVGVEVPNPAPEMVRIREVLESPDYRRARLSLPIALGRDLSGQPYTADLTKMPHLLIAGQTGSGKSVCINTLITSLICRYTPADLRLLMVDPKMVELSVYGDLPHLRHPVITDNDEAASVLKWAVYEMKRRFALLSANACRNLGEFNDRLTKGRAVFLPKRGVSDDPQPYEEGRLPYIVLVIDELADLMMTVQSEVETPLAMLAQKARAVGIHLVIATQRPSVNVLTGLIKANVPSRVAFRVASKIDSRTILDQNGAESLLGNGDMLFLPPGKSDAVRIQGAFISSGETERILDWYRERAKERAKEEAPDEQDILDVVKELEEADSKGSVSSDGMDDRDALFRQAAEIVIANSAGSTSLLQRRLKIGYGRAARIIDQLHHAGVVGPAEGSKPREVLLSLIDLDEELSEN
ncbi:MAG: DNA translocase FtsK 4TM domain-containing protein [Gemmatimonadetes bacterium]|nr:DNA translocase FtsK 4TM domain-containing protein [Gemmatimonadota bacterium]